MLLTRISVCRQLQEKHSTNGYFEVKGVDGCFYFINKTMKRFTEHSRHINTKPAFYSDSSGNIPLGALKVDIERDTLDLQARPPTATPAPPKPTPEPYFIGDAPLCWCMMSTRNSNQHKFQTKRDYVPADLVKVSDYIDTSLVTVSSTAKYANNSMKRFQI